MLHLFFARLAASLFDYRARLLGVSLASFALLFGILNFTDSGFFFVAAQALFGPLVFFPWGLLCACVWFHPQRGLLLPESKLFGQLPSFTQALFRGYASFVLAVVLILSAFVWPVCVVFVL